MSMRTQTGRKPPRILIADDQSDVRDALQLLFKAEGFDSTTAGSPERVLELISQIEFDLVLIDLNYTRDTTSGQEGLDLLSRIMAADHAVPIVVMTAWANVDLAVEAMRRGARDFLQKPWDNERLLSIARTQIELGNVLRQSRRLEAENRLLRDQRQQPFIAKSRAMQPVLQWIERVAPTDANVLVTGENGTGKGLVAQVLHARSPRASKPLISVNLGGLSEGVFESELFGHVRGAFTDAKNDRVGRFELADGGTLFLDEIANLPLSHQAKLLRVVETGEFERVGSSKAHKTDVRIIAATNANLREEVAAGRFRQDLFFRLNTIEIHLPPLRDRRDDIVPLARHYLEKHARHYRKTITGFESGALKCLVDYSWPGNVRELDHVLLRGVLMARGDQIQAADLGLQPVAAANQQEMSLEQLEAQLIQRTLARFNGNARQAAEALGLSRSAFYRRLQKYQL